MSILIFSNALKGISGLDKSIVETSYLFVDENYDVNLISLVGATDGFAESTPTLKLSEKVKLYSFQSLAAQGEDRFASRWKKAFEVEQEFLKITFLKHHLNLMREITSGLNESDTIIFTHPVQSLLYLKSKSCCKAKKIIQIHGNFLDERHNFELLDQSKYAIDYIQVVAESMIADLSKELALPQDKFVYIPNIHCPKNIIKRAGKKNISIIGSLQERKNQIDAIKMMSVIKDPDAKLKIWGGTRTRYATDLKRYTEAAGLSDKIAFMDNGTEEEIYGETDVVIMTSRSEGFSYIMPEASSYKIPMVLYDFKYGPKDFVEDGKNGFIVPYGNYQLLARKVELLLKNEALREKFGCVSYEKYKTQLSRSLILKKYQAIVGKPNNAKTSLEKFLKRNANLPAIQNISYKSRKKFVSRNKIGPHYIDKLQLELTGRPTADCKKVMIITRNRRFEVSAKAKGKRLQFVVSPLKNIKGVPEKYYAYLKINEGYEYIYHTKLKGGIETSSNEKFFYKELLPVNEIRKTQHLLSTNGLNIQYPSHEMVRSVTNENGEKISYRTTYLNRQGNRYPYLNIWGNFKLLKILMNSGRCFYIHFPNMQYKEIYQTIDRLEEEYELLNYQTKGVYVWELIKASLIDLIMEFTGNWSKLFAKGEKINREFKGTKRLSHIKSGKRLVFEFSRKRGSVEDLLTKEFHDNNSIVVEYPGADGYSLRCLDPSSNVFPAEEFLCYAEKEKNKIKHYNERYFEELFLQELGIDTDFSQIINFRINKFLKEYGFWNDFFKTRSFDEVIVPSAYWFPGLIRAAKEAGIYTSDVQYAMCSPLHPNYGFKRRKEYTADNVYLWSEFWINNALPYKNISILLQNKMMQHLHDKTKKKNKSVLILSQTRLNSLMLRFTLKLANELPEYYFNYAVHPDDDESLAKNFFFESGCVNVNVTNDSTIELMKVAAYSLGVYSTALYEAAALGSTVIVIKFPGYEIVEREIEAGIFHSIKNVDEAKALIAMDIAAVKRDYIYK